ncbi:MAG: protein-glutamate O-methyltransferase CheR [Deltaproteobacteria bacterium]|nr:protein-glutamate O-methyltransferase CheR [Deltaproteobacteria bacterium]
MPDLSHIELPLLLDGIRLRYGFDFRDYARASFYRRVMARVEAEGVANISALQALLLHDEAAMERFLVRLTVHVTSMFRDPGFYRAFREKIVPTLATYPFVRIWHAGCSTGEEVYSMAILVEEEGLAAHSMLYATDLSEGVLALAKRGVFPIAAMKDYTRNYMESGGKRAFSAYYNADHENVVLKPSLRDKITFSPHNLVTDASPNEFNVILCRNVLIYFNPTLQERVLRLFYASLGPHGVLCLGQKESLRHTPLESAFEVFDADQRIYRRIE